VDNTRSNRRGGFWKPLIRETRFVAAFVLSLSRRREHVSETTAPICFETMISNETSAAARRSLPRDD
jgi:hypothetical protein